MSNPTIDALRTLRNKLIKDHKAAIELIDKQIESMEISTGDRLELFEDIYGVKKTTPPAYKNAMRTSYDISSSSQLTELSDRITTSKHDYNLVNIELTDVFGQSAILTIREVLKSNPNAFNDFTIAYNASCSQQLASIIHHRFGLNSPSFLATLIRQNAAGAKRVEVNGIPGLNYIVANVIASQYGSVGRPVSYYFPRSAVNSLPMDLVHSVSI